MPKKSPFSSLSQLIRVLAKALIFALLLNAVVLALGVDPVRVLVRLNTYHLLGHGRERLAYPSDFRNGQLPLDALMAMHAISSPKHPDEFRVVLLGESGIAGWGLPDEATLAAQLTGHRIRIAGNELVAYNLAYPHPSVVRDLLILDAALAYAPDLIVWFVTPSALNDAPDVSDANPVFFDLNRGQLERLARQYPDSLGEWYRLHAPALLSEEPTWLRYVAIHDQDLLPIWLNALLYPFVSPDLAVSNRRIGLEPVPEEAFYTDEHPGFYTMPNVTWQVLKVGCRHAASQGADLLLVNEPMAIGGGPYSAINYNQQYSRALYDRYRQVLAAYADEQGIGYVDLWDAIPPERFTDTVLHADAQGYAILADRLSEMWQAGIGGSDCD